MLDTLQFVQGAIAKKDLVPHLTHFRIKDGRVTGFNGVISLSGPIDLDLMVNPKAAPFVRAIQTCTEAIQLHVTEGGRLSVRSGRFRALIDCIPDLQTEVEPAGAYIELTGDLLGLLRRLFPFIAEDASRPWARGIHLNGQSAFVTNNVILIEQWLDDFFPVQINLPRFTVVELLRIREEPIGMQVAGNSITFHYSGDRWLYSQLYSTDWPDVRGILEHPTHNLKTPPAGLWDALGNLMPFVDETKRVYFENGAITTGSDGDAGASYEVSGLHEGACFNCEYLKLLEPVVNVIDFTTYPNPCLFFGDKLRGAIVGMRR